jgi:ABC-type antimicrobial peptide transport system permease subunit
VYAPYTTDFLPDTTYDRYGMVLLLRGASVPVAAVLEDLIRRYEPESAVAINPLISFVRRNVARQRFQTTLLSAFAAVAVVLATLGVGSVVAFSLSRRTREIGLRIALGATPRDVVTRVMREGVVPASVGLGIGTMLAVGLSRFLESYLFGVVPTEPSAYAITAVSGVVLVALAAWIPARRAAHIDPMAAIGSE